MVVFLWLSNPQILKLTILKKSMLNNILQLIAAMIQSTMLIIMYYNSTKLRIPFMVNALFPIFSLVSYATMNYFFFIPLLFYFYIIGQKYSSIKIKKLSWFYSVYTIFSYSVFSYFTQTLISFFLGDTFLNKYFYILNITVISITPVIFNFLVLKLISPNLTFIKEHIEYLNNSFFTVLNILLTILCTIQFSSYWVETFFIKKDNPIRIYMLTFFMLIVVTMTRYIGHKINILNEEEIKRLKDQQLLDLKNYVSQIENTYEQLRYFKHDFKNILISMHESIKTNNIDVIRDNYEQILNSQDIVTTNNDFTEIFPKLNNIKTMPVKSILYAHLVNALQKKISVSLEITDPIENEPIGVFDYVRILSVLLDNALEESEKYSDGIINIYFINESLYELTIIIENTFHGNYPNISDLFKPSVSSKGNNHGLGLASVELILNKYKNISLETEISKKMFTQKIIMKW